MSKYIIDVGEGYIRHGLERTLTIPVRINEYEDHWMDTRIPVTPYTEPVDIEKVRKEAYQKGLDDAMEGKASCQFCEYEMCSDRSDPCRICACNYTNLFEPKKREQDAEKPICTEDVMRQYLNEFCTRSTCTNCVLYTPEFTCGRGFHFSYNPVSDEEVRKAYFTVLKNKKE